MMQFVVKYVPSALRSYVAPITMRFAETDELIAAMQVLSHVDPDDDTSLTKFSNRAMKQIARELIRRDVRFWKEL